jgi:xanthine dehydrogenase accessory factor
MTEIQTILAAFERIDLSTEHAALATVVRIEGSSYRRPGARMIMTSSGHWTGAISGGCLEGDTLRLARIAIAAGIPTVVRYDTMDDDANVFGVGLGCNGIIDILIEPIQSADDACIRALKSLQSPNDKVVQAIVFQSDTEDLPVGTRLVVDSTTPTPADAHPELLSAALHQLALGKSGNYTLKSGLAEVLLEVVLPQSRLMIFGNSFDATRVAIIAETLGWEVTLSRDTDNANLIAAQGEIPPAVCHLPTTAILKNVRFDARTVCVVMSHNYYYDLSVIRQLLQTNAPYIGLLGPRKKWEKMRKEIGELRGHDVTDAEESRIYSPVGLDIGAETPEEIALAIIAEMQMFLQGGTGSSLREKQGTIHE